MAEDNEVPSLEEAFGVEGAAKARKATDFLLSLPLPEGAWPSEEVMRAMGFKRKNDADTSDTETDKKDTNE